MEDIKGGQVMPDHLILRDHRTENLTWVQSHFRDSKDPKDSAWFCNKSSWIFIGSKLLI